MTQHIIVVDDMPYWLKRMIDELAKLGYDIASFDSPHDARKFFEEKEESVVLVVSDNQMIIGDRTVPNRGIDLLREIRLVAQSKENVPLILFTSEASPDQRQQVKDLGGVVVLKNHSVSGALFDKAKEVLSL